MIAQIGISHKLWLPIDRGFPEIPAIEWLPLELGLVGDAILLALLVGGLLWLMVRPFNRLATGLVVAASIIFIIEDIARLQPWLYLFELMLVIIAVAEPRRRAGDVRALLVLLLASLYVWSGVQKLNVAFTVEVMPWLLSPFGVEGLLRQHRALAYIAPAVELFIGLALAAWRLRRTAVLLGFGLHLGLLVLLSPLGHNWNMVVWPWNIAMALILYRLVWPSSREDDATERRSLAALRSSPLLYCVLLLGWILPALNFAGLWDSRLSGSLYSGNTLEAIFYHHEEDAARLLASQPEISYFYPTNGEEFIMLDYWALEELEAPFYPERRYFKALGRKLCDCVADKEHAGIKITVRAKFSSVQSLETYSCIELAK